MHSFLGPKHGQRYRQSIHKTQTAFINKEEKIEMVDVYFIAFDSSK